MLLSVALWTSASTKSKGSQTDGVRSASTRARCLRIASAFVLNRCRLPLKNCLEGINHVPITQDAWLRAPSPRKAVSALGTLFSGHSFPLQEPLVGVLRHPRSQRDRHQTQFRHSHPGGCCVASRRRDPDLLFQLVRRTHSATQGDRTSLELLQVPQVEPSWLAEATHLSLTGMPISHVPPCNSVFAFLSSTKTQCALRGQVLDCFSDEAALCPCDARDPGHRKSKLACSSPDLTLTAFHIGPAMTDLPTSGCPMGRT